MVSIIVAYRLTPSQVSLGAQHSSSNDKNPEMISKQSYEAKPHQKQKKPPKESSFPHPVCPSLRITRRRDATNKGLDLLGFGRKEKELQRESPALSWSTTGLFELSSWAPVV